MDKLRFGTAGIPLGTQPRNTVAGVRFVRQLGLDAMELEFVQSVHISAVKAPLVRAAAREADVLLTCHAPYYINLNARDPATRQASVDRLVNSARALAACGGWSACFHAGFYLGMEHALVYQQVKEALQLALETLRAEGLEIWLRPEIGGKTTSWGSLEEILRISQELDGVLPCIDWAHLHARSLGKHHSYEAFCGTLEAMEKALGKEALQNLHCHVEGIEIGPTGERSHKNLADADLHEGELIRAFRDFGCRGAIICESPNIEADALHLQRLYRGA
ncbi:MAG: TIM barrel protein [Candidatus Aenigmarchaeota archaeon]|nr:TIM barrel protein [Candidatus Aenigmarchaeota archaeon]